MKLLEEEEEEEGEEESSAVLNGAELHLPRYGNARERWSRID